MELYPAMDEINNALKKNHIIVIFSNCNVEYSGRAQSFIAKGDRMIIMKHDGTILVHKPDGRTPVNWMPNKSIIEIKVENDSLEITCTNSKTSEVMIIRAFNIYSITSAPLVDNEQLRLLGTEKDMSDMLYSTPSLISEDFTPVSREEQTKYGFLDVFGHNSKGELVIVECKRYTAGLDSVTQLRRYVERVKKSKGITKVQGIIAAPNISQNALKMLTDWGFSYKNISPPYRFSKEEEKQAKINEF
ncbi:Endonuclease NucS [Candidatus Tiddalikarchaeum anstoanum]|nr:Endonuclease NucS [Candidatus Tiddalikarchaeum anstoanum]